MSSEFYRAFEDEFRGGRELIKSRLAQYLHFLDPLKRTDPDVTAVDLGCGRGEWLELMGEHGIAARGIDLDDGMLAACRERNFDVETGDAIVFLKSLPDESVSLVSAFHLVEHIPFNELKQLVEESLRVLKPAGLLILETPNPENLIVGTASFYFDPSHEKPIPSQLLNFLPKHYGFSRTKIVRLQEPSDIESKDLNLLDVFVGVSPDYAVVAQKAAPEVELALFDCAFEREYGVSLEKLAMTYSKQADNRETLAEQRTRADMLQREADAVRARLEALAEEKGRLSLELRVERERLLVLQDKINEQEVNALQMQKALDTAYNDFAEAQRVSVAELAEAQRVSDAELAEEKRVSDAELAEAKRVSDVELAEAQSATEHWLNVADNLDGELQRVYRSKSWKITSPLRKIAPLARWLVQLPKRCVRLVLVRAMAFVIERPVLTGMSAVLLKRLPMFHQKLRHLAHARGLIDIYTGQSPEEDMINLRDDLTPHARRIFRDLASANHSQGGQS